MPGWPGATDATWAPHGGESRVDVAARSLPVVAELVSGEPEWGDANQPDRPVVLVAHGGLIAALSAALLKLPVANWPILGGMGNASWVQLSGHSHDDADPSDPAGIRWRLDVWNASAQVLQRCPLSVRADAAGVRRLVGLLRAHRRSARRRSSDLAQYCCFAIGLGLGADRPHRLDLPRRLVGSNAGPAVLGGVAAGGRGDLRHQRDGFAAVGVADRAARADPLRASAAGCGAGSATATAGCNPGLSPVARSALPPHLSAEYLEQTRGAIDFNRPGIPIVASLPSVHIAETYGKAHHGRAGTAAAITDWAQQPRYSLGGSQSRCGANKL